MIEITDLTLEGQGVGKKDGKVYFIPNTLPGDVVTLKNIKKQKRIFKGQVEEYIKKSPDRIQAKCPYFEECDGCSLQNMTYEKELDLKGEGVRNTLNRLGGEDLKELHVIPAEDPYGYRNKIELKHQEGKLGYYSRQSHSLVAIKECPIALPVIDGFISKLDKILKDLYQDPSLEKGVLRNITLRGNGEYLQITLSIGKKDFYKKKEFYQALEVQDEVIQLYENWIKNPRQVGIRNPKEIFKKKEFIDTIGKYEFKLSPESFFQVNFNQTLKLYEAGRDMMDLQGGEKLLDLYCGIGTTSIFYAEKAGKVVGIEVIPKAIENAVENRKRNGIENVDFHCGKAEDLIEKLLEKNDFDLISVDPPRKGLDEKVIRVIGKTSIPKVLYISCNPGTLARDIKLFKEVGYKVVNVKGCDMFSRTMHTEVIALLQRG